MYRQTVKTAEWFITGILCKNSNLLVKSCFLVYKSRKTNFEMKGKETSYETIVWQQTDTKSCCFS